jgi:hypothetical protein
MMRVITTPPVLPPEALAELKQWLAITTTQDDGELADLLAMAVDVCADFTGLLPLACTTEEMLALPTDEWPARGLAPVPGSPPPWRPWTGRPDWQQLASRPVRSLLSVAAVAIDGTSTTLDAADYHVRIDAEGGCGIRIINPGTAHRFAVQVTAGLAADWASLPQGLHHGIIRLAAHQYRSREGTGAAALPPASVSALWLPWRRMRLV